MFKLGDTVTVEQLYKFAPLGLALICHEYRDCDCYYEEDEDDDDAECCCGSGEYDIILRYSLSEFPPLTSTASIQSYESHFPEGLAPKPGFIWDSSEYGIEQLYSWSSIPNNFVVPKLPIISLLKKETIMRIGDTATVEMFLKYGPLGMQLKSDGKDGYLCYYAEVASALSEEDIEYYSSYCSRDLPFVPGFVGVEYDSSKTHLHSGWGCVRNGDWKIYKLPTVPLLKRKSV